MPADLAALLDDLRAEHDDLDRLVDGVDLEQPSAAAGWTIGDCLGHLWFFDREATKALTRRDDFTAGLQDVIADPDGYSARALAEPRALGAALAEHARDQRRELLAALAVADPATKVPWYGPPMSPASFATARLMEYWAHGQDIADALSVTRPPTARLRHICHLGVRTRGFSYAVRGRTAPDSDVRVELTAPDGDVWAWGDTSTPNRVEGGALDFCLVVTQRRHLDDTGLVVTGAEAREWLLIAQAFAGGATLTDPARAGMTASVR
jgi:uncharacterized protein (TIGR03084 family)